MYSLLKNETWDDDFFKVFVEFKNHIHKDIVTSFPESIEDYARFFKPGSVFAPDFKWQAFVIKKNENIIAQAILTWRRDSASANLGFLDWIDDESAAEELISAVVEFAKTKNFKTIKAPVDINFFIKYRIRMPGGMKPFYGEPIYPDYYHDLFKLTGFKVIGEWDTYSLNRLMGIKDFFTKRKKLAQKSRTVSQPAQSKTTIRSIRMREWDKELRIIYDLFMESYRSMPEFESISFEQYKLIYDDFKYIVQPWLSYIVELGGKPVAFSINFVDPLPVLVKYHGKKLSPLQKALVFLQLRLNNGTFMIAHVGKIPGPDGEEVKGVQVQVSRRITFFSFYMRKVIVSFQNVDSPSRKTWNPEVQNPYARYVLYGMEL